jgi:hypothetical protein
MSRKTIVAQSKKRKISTWIIAWTDNFMQNRRINFVVEDETTTMSNVNVDISHDFSIEFILYLFYNIDFLKLLKRLFRWIVVIDFVNDINIFTYDFNIMSNCRVLKRCIRIAKYEHVDMKLFSRRSNTSSFIWREIQKNLTCKQSFASATS